MARRKARAARVAANKENDDNTATDITLPDAPPLPSTDGAPPGGQAQARQQLDGNSKKRKSPHPDTPVLETAEVNGVTYKVQPEGLAKILLPNEKSHEVFYNYIQQFNRDMTMAVTRAFGEVLESERKASKRKHRGGFKHKKKQKTPDSNNNPAAVAAAELVVPAEDTAVVEEEEMADDVEFTIDGANPTDDPTKPKPRFAVLDALSATGLRALRYAKEIPFVTHVTANDMSPSAVESITRNVEFNGVSDIVRLSHDNAVGHMYRTAFPAYLPDPAPGNPHRMKQTRPEKYHVIDLDPYGSAAPFIDSALQALEDGGLLSVTCTDAAIFASTSYPEKTFATYGGLPSKGDYSHEAGLRMVLMSIATTAARYGLHIEPLLSLSIDYYCRVFVRVRKSPENVKKLASKSMVVVACDSGCGSWKAQEMGTMRERTNVSRTGVVNTNFKYGIAQAVDSGNCEHCGFKMHVAGPMWSDPIHSAGFLNHLLSNVLGNEVVREYGTLGRVTGMLKLALGELMPVDTPPPTPAPASPVQKAVEDRIVTPAPGQAPLAEGEPVDRPTVKRKARQRADAAVVINGTTPTSTSTPYRQRNPTSDPLALFIMPTQLSRVLHCEAPSVSAVRGALLGLGYHVTKSHCRPGSLKTNAPWSALWRIMRAWIKVERPIKDGTLSEGMAGYRILYGPQVDPAEDFSDVVFDEALGKDKDKAKGEIMYQMNPNAYWGPMAKANKKGLTAEESSRQGNAEKDKRRREEKERRMKEAEEQGVDLAEQQQGNRKRRKNKKGGNSELEGGDMLPPAIAAEQIDVTKGVTEETPARTRESDGAQYGMAGISASDLQRLDEQESAARKA